MLCAHHFPGNHNKIPRNEMYRLPTRILQLQRQLNTSQEYVSISISTFNELSFLLNVSFDIITCSYFRYVLLVVVLLGWVRLWHLPLKTTSVANLEGKARKWVDYRRCWRNDRAIQRYSIPLELIFRLLVVESYLGGGGTFVMRSVHKTFQLQFDRFILTNSYPHPRNQIVSEFRSPI